ncbi:MAG: hypothetical protein V7707_03460 [Motiliproteus sp.]
MKFTIKGLGNAVGLGITVGVLIGILVILNYDKLTAPDPEALAESCISTLGTQAATTESESSGASVKYLGYKDLEYTVAMDGDLVILDYTIQMSANGVVFYEPVQGFKCWGSQEAMDRGL